MNQEDRQVFKLKKQLIIKGKEFERERAQLQQKIDMLSSQISQYHQKEIKNRQVNESVIMSIRQNESFRDHYNEKKLQNLSNRHQEELKRLKQKHKQEKRKLEQEVACLKSQKERMKIQIQRVTLQREKDLATLSSDWEERIISKEEDLNNLFNHKLDLMAEKLKQSEQMCKMYRDQIEKRFSKDICSLKENSQPPAVQEEEEDQPEEIIKTNRNQPLQACLKKKPEDLSSLQLRINRALTQIQPNSVRLEQKIREIKMRHI